jgi:PAS domain S-box-containing protein
VYLQRVSESPQQLLSEPGVAEVLEQLPQGVWLADTKGRIRYTNHALEQMFGYERGELAGQHLIKLFAPCVANGLGRFREITETVQQRGIWRGDCLNKRKDGREFTSFLQIRLHGLPHEQQWIGVQEEGAAAHFLNQFSSNYIALALRELQSSYNEIFGWARLIRAGQMNAQQAVEALESIERRTHSQQQLLANLLELAQLAPDSPDQQPVVSALPVEPPERSLPPVPATSVHAIMDYQRQAYPKSQRKRSLGLV